MELFHGAVVLFVGFGFLWDPVLHLGIVLTVLSGWLVCDGCFIQKYQRRLPDKGFVFHTCEILMDHTPFVTYVMFHLAIIDFFLLFPYWKAACIFIFGYLGLLADCYLN